MSNKLGVSIQLTIFGQSHAPGLGCVIEGLPAGVTFDWSAVGRFMDRRAPGRSDLATTRRESDRPEIISGLNEGGETCGAPLCAVIRNENQRSGDYDALRDRPRPGHADLPAHIKWNGFNDVRGGGHFSARLTAPLCAAGGILTQLYARRGIRIGAHLYEAAGVKDTPMDPMRVSEKDLDALLEAPLPVFDLKAGERMLSAVAEARREGDSRGGIVECAVLGLKPGLGEPMFGGLENLISRAVFAVPAVKGIEFGEGFGAARLRGSENNDPYRMGKDGPAPVSNHAGGILGGLATGAPLIFRAAFKPTPSIALRQDTVDLVEMKDASLEITGRHDPCVALRAVPCVEAAAAVALADLIL